MVDGNRRVDLGAEIYLCAGSPALADAAPNGGQGKRPIGRRGGEILQLNLFSRELTLDE